MSRREAIFSLGLLEARRLLRERKFWCYALLVYPLLLPMMVVGLSVLSVWLLQSSKESLVHDVGPLADGSRPLIQVRGAPLPIPLPEETTLLSEPLSTDQIQTLVVESTDSAVVDLHVDNSGHVTAVVYQGVAVSSAGQRVLDSSLGHLRAALSKYHAVSAGFPIEDVSLALDPLTTRTVTVRQQLLSSTLLALVLWYGVPWAAFTLLERVGSTSLADDASIGALWPVGTSAVGFSTWLVGRYLGLVVVAILLVAFYGAVVAAWLNAYGAFADWTVSGGILEALPERDAEGFRRFVVDIASQWGSFGLMRYLLFLFLSMTFLVALSGVVLAVSVLAIGRSDSALRGQVAKTTSSMLPVVGAVLPFLFVGFLERDLWQALALLPGVGLFASSVAIATSANWSFYVLLMAPHLGLVLLALAAAYLLVSRRREDLMC